jgi:hypothetical protein
MWMVVQCDLGDFRSHNIGMFTTYQEAESFLDDVTRHLSVKSKTQPTGPVGPAGPNRQNTPLSYWCDGDPSDVLYTVVGVDQAGHFVLVNQAPDTLHGLDTSDNPTD